MSQSLTVTLITGRTLDQGRGREEGKFTELFYRSTAMVELDPEDFNRLNPKGNVKVKTDYGEVVVQPTQSLMRHPGIGFIPMGPWANIVIDPNTRGSGMPTFKGVKATIEVTSEPILRLNELLLRYYGREARIPTISDPPSYGVGERVVEAVPCPYCGCLCDDITVTVKDGRIVSVKGGCALSNSKFLHYNDGRIVNPMVKINGEFKPISLEEAVKRTAEILVNSKYPLLYGWSSTSIQAIRVGIELTELIGGVIDNTTATCHGPTLQGIHYTGTVTSTLGQMRNRADLMIFWGCNPLNAHPKHATRYSATAKGVYIRSRKDRKIVVVDVRETATSRMADLFIKVEPGKDYELITALRMALYDHDIEQDFIAGVSREKIYELADIMRSAKFGVLFFGLGVTMSEGKERNIEEVEKLVQDLNSWTKFVLLAMRGHFNVTGANAASLWLTGYPYAIDFSRGFPRYNPSITSGTELLINGDVDVALIVASDPIAHFPRKAVENLLKIPTIVIDPKWSVTASTASIVIPCAYVGIECEGTAYRMDGVPLRLRKIVDPPLGIVSDVDVLNMILNEVKRIVGG